MEFVIGGAYQGKKEAACRLFGLDAGDLADGSICEMQEIFQCRAVFNFHEYIRRMLAEKESVEGLAEEIGKRNPNIVIISNEIGYGIVPLDAFERLWREQTGRVCCRIAQQSEHVIRVVAGVENVIKGTIL